MTDSVTPATVLIVEDEPMTVMLLGRILREASCKVVAARNGAEALPLSEEADLVLLDISLPDMDGFDVASRIKERGGDRQLPIVFLSGYTDPARKVRAFEQGASDYITKPFDFDEVRVRVLNQLSLATMRRQVEEQNRELRRKNEELERAVKEQRRQEEQLSDSQKMLASTERSLDRIFTALSEVLPGTVLDNRYRLESHIGSGGFGAVYRATHLVLDRPIAVKVLQPPRGDDAEIQLERFKAEAMSAYRFNHPNAVSVLDASVSSSGLPYIVMELLEGWSLREEIDNAGRLTTSRCAEIIVPVCDVITRAHKAGFTHRDLKPDNIFVATSGDVETIKVLDFGLARLHRDLESMPASGKGEGSIFGTPVYMAPEAFAGDESQPEKIDVYALAAVTFEVLTGRPPFLVQSGGMATLITEHMTAQPPRLRDLVPDIPVLLENLVLAGLEKKADLRPSIRAFGEQLVIATLADREPETEEDRETLRLKPLDDD